MPQQGLGAACGLCRGRGREENAGCIARVHVGAAGGGQAELLPRLPGRERVVLGCFLPHSNVIDGGATAEALNRKLLSVRVHSLMLADWTGSHLLTPLVLSSGRCCRCWWWRCVWVTLGRPCRAQNY